ncbi:MAG: lipid-A-disaccharide synthase [Rickettsiales bacterium]|jgi:lipid-A-disaccharide synthase|nr:lipid-A-disaccharide synthase [Rickettsiales bacterium]
MKIFIIAGESSGDLLGAKLVKELNKRFKSLKITGVGGEQLINAGLEPIFNLKDISVNGLIEVIPHIPRLLSRINASVDAIINFQPDLIITIDAPDFNFRVIKKLKQRAPNLNSKIVHYVAPTVWAYRKKRAKKIAQLYDLLLVILPFEPPYFEDHGLKTNFIGHPIFSDFQPKEVTRKSNNVIITPGSRRSEILRFKSMLKELIYLIKSNFGTKFNLHLFVTQETKDLIYSIYEQEIKKSEVNIVIKNTKKAEILDDCYLAILKSGTNTMELANESIAMIIFYRFSTLTYFIATKILRVKSRYANLLNYQANHAIIPEYLHARCKADLIYQEFRNYYYHKEKRYDQIAAYSKIISKFKNPDQISPETKAVNAIEELFNKKV